MTEINLQMVTNGNLGEKLDPNVLSGLVRLSTCISASRQRVIEDVSSVEFIGMCLRFYNRHDFYKIQG